jgi:hypothetical protein
MHTVAVQMGFMILGKCGEKKLFGDVLSSPHPRKKKKPIQSINVTIFSFFLPHPRIHKEGVHTLPCASLTTTTSNS